jgi:hypothetical protein
MYVLSNARESLKNVLPYGIRIIKRKGRPILKRRFGRCSNPEITHPYPDIYPSISNSYAERSKLGSMSNQAQRPEWNGEG